MVTGSFCPDVKHISCTKADTSLLHKRFRKSHMHFMTCKIREKVGGFAPARLRDPNSPSVITGLIVMCK